MQASYRGDLSSRTALERVFEKGEWGAPRAAQHLYEIEFGPDRQLADYGETRAPDGMTVFPWRDLTAAERAVLHDRLAAGEIPAWASPFQLETTVDFECSVGLRRTGAEEDVVAGWMVTHRLGEDLVQYTALFVEPGLRRRHAGLALGAAARRRQRDRTQTSTALWTVDARNEAMKAFVETHLREALTSSTTRQLVGKRLPASS